MFNRFDRFILSRLFGITAFLLGFLVLLFVIIDFSENSDDFTDRGAKLGLVFQEYYLPYIPEMVRLVAPVAAFVACLLFTGQLSDRFEIVALKSAGVSLQRIMVPYLIFAISLSALLFYLDGWVIPPSNLKRHAFERKYLAGKVQLKENRDLYRQPDPASLIWLQFINENGTSAFNTELFTFDSHRVDRHFTIDRMNWMDTSATWQIESGWSYDFDSTANFDRSRIQERDTTFPLFPRDLARTSSDVYELTYPQIADYLASLERSGAMGDHQPRVQFYGKMAYPLTVIIAMVIGLPLASYRSKRGKGVHIATGLSVSFIYLTAMKVAEPFGAAAAIPAWLAAAGPHAVFLLAGIVLFVRYRQ